MRTYTFSMESFVLSSQWECAYRLVSGVGQWYMRTSPTVDNWSIEFPVSLPPDAIISRSWVSVVLGVPSTGAAYKRMNDINIPANGEVDADGITPENASFKAAFSFKANGAIYENTDVHTSLLRFDSPTLHIEYSSEIEEGDPPDEDGPGDIDRGENMGIQLPRLLDSDMREVCRLYPSRMSLEMHLKPLSTAVMVIPWGQHEVKVRDFMELFNPDGSVGIFRVSEVDNGYGGGGIQRVYLEHAFTTLSDSIAVGVQAMSGSFRMVISSLLEAQADKRWVLGDVEFPEEYEIVYSYSYDNLFNAIMDLTEQLPEGYAWEFDTWRIPWVMHLRKLTDESFCECRLRRNLAGARIIIDTSRLCTRIYPFGSGEGMDRINLSTLTGALYEDADTMDTWGVVSRSFTREDIFDSITLQGVAQMYLERYKNPLVSVVLDALALYASTGETLDQFRLGTICRLPLAAYNISMMERVISVKYPDVYGSPKKAEVTLANKIRSTSDELAALMREATQSKLIGGTVSTTEHKSSADSITIDSPMVSYFDVESYGNLLAARVSYTCTPEGGGLPVNANVAVDGVAISGASSMGNTVDIFPYLKRDDSGIPVVGQHYVTISPLGSLYDYYWVHTTVTLKTIEKQ